MLEKILGQIEKLSEIIYTPDQKNFDTEFIIFLDWIDEYIKLNNEDEKILNLFLSLQKAYIKKDFIEIVDILLYQIKPYIMK